MNPANITWHELLIQKGINPSTATSLVSFISWNENTEYPNLGQKITSILSSNKGNIIVKDAVCTKYGDRGLLFLNQNLQDDEVSNIFNIIMDCEQESIYK